MRVNQPDHRIKAENLGEWSKFITHTGPGCPRMALIELHDGYLRCCYCGTPLTDEAAQHIVDNIGDKIREETTPNGRKAFAWV